MLLVLTNSEDLTADYVLLAMRELGFPYFRFNSDQYPAQLRLTFQHGDRPRVLVEDPVKCSDLTAVRVVWYRRALAPRVSQMPFAPEVAPFIHTETRHCLEGTFLSLGARWVNPIASTMKAERKLFQLGIAETCGLRTPRTVVSNEPERLREMVRTGRPVVCKPVYSGLQQGVDKSYAAYTRLLDGHELLDDEAIRACPTLVQEYVDKAFDVRATIIGNCVFAARITTDPRSTDWRRPDVKASCERIELPHSVRDGCLRMLRRLDLVYGAFDFAVEKSGQYSFLEVNPVGEWAWLDEALGWDIRGSLIEYFQSV